MGKHFLDEIQKENQNKELVTKVEDSLNKIKDIRTNIGDLIQDYIHNKGYTKTKVFELLSNEKHIKPTQLKAMIDESYFQKKYQPTFKLDNQQIKVINKYFNKLDYSQEKRKEILQSDREEIFNIFKKIETETEELSLTKHTFAFDEDGEETLRTAINILEKSFERKVTITECIHLSLIELISSYPCNIEKEEKGLDF